MTRAHRSGRWVSTTLGVLYTMHGYRCGRCSGWIDPTLSGLHPLGGTIGHRVPLFYGGTDHLENLRPEHRRCNLRAGARTSDAMERPDDPVARIAP